MSEIDKYAQENVNRLLVGNKSDLTAERKVRFEEGEELGTANLTHNDAYAVPCS